MIRKALAGSAALLLALATALVIMAVPVAAAAPTQCVGTLAAVTVGNVVVPSGAHCEMVGTTVTGNVRVEDGASLRASGSNIAGHVIGRDVAWVCAQFGSTVGGNFDVTGGILHTTTGFDINVMVGGNAKVSENAGLTFIDAAQVGGNIDVSGNTGTLEIEHNTVGGNVKIADNIVPPVYTGGPAISGPGGCGIPTSFILNSGGMSIYNNTAENSNMHVIDNSGIGSKQVVLNTVKNLVCLHNDPPFLSALNNAQHTVGQCT